MAPHAAPPVQPRRRRRWKRWVLLALLVSLPLLLLSRTPVVPRADPPTASDVTAARGVYQRVRMARATDPQHVAVSWAEAGSVVLLGGRAVGVHHVATTMDAQRGGGLQASVPLGLGFWLNGQLWVKPDKDGRPRIRARAGRLPVPAFLVHAGIGASRMILKLRGAQVPPLDAMVSALTVDQQGLAATLALPVGSRIVGAIGELQTGGVEAQRVARHYCRLRGQQKKTPTHDLATLVRRGFTDADGSGADNRAVFVALGMLVAGRDMAALPDRGQAIFQECGWPNLVIHLQGRNDLALHWSVSGALTSVLGSQVSISLGTWKEIADSAEGGSGFSLVDLAADRSATHCAEKAAAEATARATRNWLAGVNAQDLLPVRALALAEGMSEQEFRDRFTSTESASFAATVERIDASLSVLLRC